MQSTDSTIFLLLSYQVETMALLPSAAEVERKYVSIMSMVPHWSVGVTAKVNILIVLYMIEQQLQGCFITWMHS